MNTKIPIKKRIFIPIIILIVCLWISKSYFLWSSYDPGVILIGFRAFFYASLLLLCLLLFKRFGSYKSDRKKIVKIVILMVVMCIEMALLAKDTSQLNLSRHIRDVVITVLLFYLSNSEKKIAFKAFYISFAIFVLPSIVYFILNLVGVELPFSILTGGNDFKVLKGHFYREYFCGLFIQQNGPLRPCGIFDEAGFIGTVCALFFAIGEGRVGKVWRFLILIEGIFSFSMAFYLLMCIYMFINGVMNKSKKIIVLFGCTIVTLFILANIDLNVPAWNFLRDRVFDGSGLNIINNRESTNFERGFSDFLNSGGSQLWFGNGEAGYTLNVDMHESNSIRCLIYDYGIVGSFVYVLIFILIAKMYGFNTNSIAFDFVFFFSMYQRPYTFDAIYICIFILGHEMIKMNHLELKKSGYVND